MKNRNKNSKRKKYPKAHNLYIILMCDMNGQRFFKLGYSSNINSRISTYTNKNPFCEVMTFERLDAEYFEKEFHSKYKPIVMDEWYKDALLDTLIQKINDTPNFDFNAVKQGNAIPTEVTYNTGAFNNTGSVQKVVINNYIYSGNQMPKLHK